MFYFYNIYNSLYYFILIIYLLQKIIYTYYINSNTLILIHVNKIRISEICLKYITLIKYVK